MKVYSAKTLDEALELASKDMNVPVSEISYEIIEEKKGFFKKSIQISVFDSYDVVTHVEDYLRRLFTVIGIEVKIKTKLDDETVIIELNSPSNNSILIGRQGATLDAITNLVRQSTSQHFKKFIMIRVDISGYKAKRYTHLEQLAKAWGKSVLRTKEDLVLDPLPPDERRIVHQTLSTYKNLETKSAGEGRYKRLTIHYKGSRQNEEKVESNETEE